MEMSYDEKNKHAPPCTNILRSELERNPKMNNVSVLTVNVRKISCEFEDLVTNLNYFWKQFSFNTIKASWLTNESKLVVEIDRAGRDTFFRVPTPTLQHSWPSASEIDSTTLILGTDFRHMDSDTVDTDSETPKKNRFPRAVFRKMYTFQTFITK